MLHKLTMTIYSAISAHERSKLSFVAACLHIVSPAGLFLSAPYAESSFSFINFAGFYLYARALGTRTTYREFSRDVLLVSSGILFGIATTFRGNGLLSGLVFVLDAFARMKEITECDDINATLRQLLVTCLSGVVMACIAISPQYRAYLEYCTGSSKGPLLRPWCSNWVPSIYAWVQKEYW